MAIIWKIPTDADFKELEGTVDSTYGVGNTEWDGTGFRGDDAGDNLKDPSVSNWLDGTQGWDTGWDGLPGGYRLTDGSLVMGSNSLWWSSSVNSGNAWYRGLYSSYSEVRRTSISHAFGFAVRCFRDTTTVEDSDDDGTIYTDDYVGNDGTKYNSIKLGNQVWITENLKETKWYDGTLINEETTSSGWSSAGTNSEPALMGSTSGHPSTYGYHYNWFAVDSSDDMINYDYEASTGTETNSERSIETTGKIETNSDRNIELSGQQAVTSERSIEAEGDSLATEVNSERSISTTGTTDVWTIEKNTDGAGWVELEASIQIDDSVGVYSYTDTSTFTNGVEYCYRVKNAYEYTNPITLSTEQDGTEINLNWSYET